MFAQKPILVEYNIDTISVWDKTMYLNTIYSGDQKIHSFRCPNKSCGAAVKIGFPECPFCHTRLKWKYPFTQIKL